jgi:hypothetical protein
MGGDGLRDQILQSSLVEGQKLSQQYTEQKMFKRLLNVTTHNMVIYKSLQP